MIEQHKTYDEETAVPVGTLTIEVPLMNLHGQFIELT